MGPPRLTVVSKAGDGEAATSFEKGSAVAANDAAPVGEAIGAGSPVHDLIQSLEDGAAGALPAQNAGADLERAEKLRVLEAVIFAAGEPQSEEKLATYLKSGDDVAGLLAHLQGIYATRGVHLVKVAGKWAFRTADDLSWVLERHATLERRLSKAALETLAIVAYHQPVTRAEIEDVRGVTISKGTLDVLMEAGWVRPRGRRRAPGKPITYGTTEQFLEHFGLDAVKDLPGLADLKAAGLLDANLPPEFKVPEPTDAAALMPDELPLEAGEEGDEDLQAELELDEPLGEEDDEMGGDGDGRDDHAETGPGGGQNERDRG
jgi:segregation and condensation protein B